MRRSIMIIRLAPSAMLSEECTVPPAHIVVMLMDTHVLTFVFSSLDL